MQWRTYDKTGAPGERYIYVRHYELFVNDLEDFQVYAFIVVTQNHQAAR